MKKLLVTGGAGFIGSNFIHYLLEKYQDIQLVNLDLLTYAGNLQSLKKWEDDHRYQFIKGDICDSVVVGKAMKGVDTVVHFAAESHVDRSIMNPSVFVKTNVLGTHVLLEASVQNKVKHFHHISTDEVFGSLALDSQEKFNEKTLYDPHSPYSASKAGSDHLVRAYGDTFGLPYTITNCSNNYGPYQFPEKIIPLFIANALDDKPLPIYGDGKCVRDYLYVIDHCEAIDLVLKKGKIGETYCVGGGAEKNGIEIAGTVLSILGKPKNLITFVEDRKGHDRRYAIDHGKIKKELGWEPRHNFEEAIKKTIDWYLANKEWLDDVRSGDYQKYYKIQYGGKNV